MLQKNDEVIMELKAIKKLIAIVATQGKEQNESIHLLSGLGFGNQDIGDVIGITSNAVAIAKSRAKKGSKDKVTRKG